MDFLENIPKDFINFLLVLLFALLIGLEQRSRHETEKIKFLFGTDRTFALIGIFGFVLYILDPARMLFFGIGGILLTGFLIVAYASRIWKEDKFGMTTSLIALITYCLAPLIYTQPPWLFLLILIGVLVLAGIKEDLIAFSEKFDKNEFITLAIFIALSGVILPLAPDEQIISGLDLTPYKFWLAVVAVSSISYVSYLIKKFAFPEAGLFLTGILGGMYSSTAATFTLAKKAKSNSYPPMLTTASILIATAMMYPRILVLAFIFDRSLGRQLTLPLLILMALTTGISVFFFYRNKVKDVVSSEIKISNQRNPLELQTALLFALLFVLFTTLTHFALEMYGSAGLDVLSYVVGVTDIDPFLLNLFQGKQAYARPLVVAATLQATISNNFLKAIYGSILGMPAIRRDLWIGFGAVIVASFILLIFIR